MPGEIPRAFVRGADDEIRTRDPHLGKVMLYQLSHVRVEFRLYQCPPVEGKPAGQDPARSSAAATSADSRSPSGNPSAAARPR